MRCEEIQEIISSFIDGEIVENVDKAFSHVFSCRDCQDFLKISLKFKTEAMKDKIEIPEIKKIEIARKETLPEKIKRSLKMEIPIPASLLSAVIFMLFLLSFLLGIFVYDRAMTIEAMKTQTPVYTKTRTIIVYGIPQITIYPETQKQK
jgi:hypothetical protein